MQLRFQGLVGIFRKEGPSGFVALRGIDTVGFEERPTLLDSRRESARAGRGNYDDETLEDLAHRSKLGDQEALSTLIARLRPIVRRIVQSILGSSGSNDEDISQEVLVAFTKALAAYRGESSVIRYAQRIAVRTAWVSRRQRKVWSERIDQFEQQTLAARRDPTDAVLRGQRRELIRELLDELPGVQAEAFAHRVFYGGSLKEIAGEMGTPVNTVRTRLRLAREAINKRLEDNPELLRLLRGGQ